eukprot:m.232249 g.232249  ORF g.232249 m.232249 type:complete len:54 (-) comp19272_c0_seq8:960-1121(-)
MKGGIFPNMTFKTVITTEEKAASCASSLNASKIDCRGAFDRAAGQFTSMYGGR